MAGQKVAAPLRARNSEVGMMAGSSSDLQPLSSLGHFQEIPAFSYGKGSARPAGSRRCWSNSPAPQLTPPWVQNTPSW